MTNEETRILITEVCNDVRDMLLAKNAAYGNSALEPLRIFSRCDAEEQLRVRLDDKLSRLARGENAGEDTLRDLVGYGILLLAAQRQRPPAFADEVAESMAGLRMSKQLKREALDREKLLREYQERECATAQERARGKAWQRGKEANDGNA